MTSGLDTFAKVRALHDSTTYPDEKASAAAKMEVLARKAGLTVQEAMSKLDAEASRPAPGMDWSAFAEAFWKTEAAAETAANAPEAPSRRWGLPIYDPNKVERWRDVAVHCLQLDWIIPKAHGGKFLTKDERARLKAISHYGPVTNATADWIETVLSQCEVARKAWRDRGKAGVRPDRKATESDIEKAAELVAAAKRREASRMDNPEPVPRTAAQAASAAFNEFFSSPEMRAAAAKREAERQVQAAAVIAEHGSEEAVFADTPREAALRAACAHLYEPCLRFEGAYRLAGWDPFDGRDKLPASVREAVSQGWPLPETVAQALAEFDEAERLERDRCTLNGGDYNSHSWVEARRCILEEMLDRLPARSMRDLRARLAWMQHVLDLGFSRPVENDQACLNALRGDVDRMGERIRAAEHGSAVQTGHRPTTRADRRAAASALIAEGLSDREVARRLGISPSTVGNIRRAA